MPAHPALVASPELLKNVPVEVAEILARAVEMVPVAAVNDPGSPVSDAREYLDHNAWELALDLLADLADGWQPTASWWDLLIKAADLMWLTDTAAWCHWRRWESIHGIIRAELRLLAPAEGGRTNAIPGHGILRPLWNIGRNTATGQPNLRVARVGGVCAGTGAGHGRLHPARATGPT